MINYFLVFTYLRFQHFYDNVYMYFETIFVRSSLTKIILFFFGWLFELNSGYVSDI